jgi:predicted negative regulator of RcsB-dependent stress response
VAYDLEEQEQLAAIKAWWQQYGNLVMLAATAALLTIAAYQGWRYYKHTRTAAALALYEQLERAQRGGEQKKTADIAAQIVSGYGGTPYAVMAALISARVAVAGGDLAGAKTQLKWVMDGARDEDTRDLARLRLAGVLLDEKNHQEALALVETKVGDSLAGLYSELKGDILAAQGKAAEARNAYQLALDKSESGSTYRATVQLKMDALGEPAASK